MSATTGPLSVDSEAHYNPLDCLLCAQELQDPVRLPCHHAFCRRCCSSRSNCPLCLEAFDPEPPGDTLLAFLIDISHEAAEICANCDKITLPMHFCETCQQALCNDCRVNTHQAKMFASHRLVLLEERARVKGRVTCAAHDEPYILFSTENRRLACINCFKSTPNESRHHYLNVESAHKIGVERMEKVAQKLRVFQESCNDQVQLRRRLLNELDESHRSATASIRQTCQEMIETLVAARDRLIKEIDDDRKTRDQHFREQMNRLRAIQLPIQSYLFGASIFCSSASKLDFLHSSQDLIKRMQAVMGVECPRALYTGEMAVTPRDELARALEPLLGLSSLLISATPLGAEKIAGDTVPYKHPSYVRRSGSAYDGYAGLTISSKYQLIVDLAGAFGEQFDRIAGPLRHYSILVGALSRDVQESQRDLTMRRRLIEAERIAELNARCTVLETRLAEHSNLIQERQPHLSQLWQEQLDRVRRQQIIFREKVEDTVYLRDQIRRLSAAARQLEPFACSLHALVTVIDRRRCHPPDPAPMELICHEINTIEPDSAHRCQAIEKEESIRRLAQEKRKDEQNVLAISAKRQLKSNKEQQRQTRRDTPQSMSCNVSIVTRDRSRGGTDPAIVSPSKRRQKSLRDEQNLLEDGELWIDCFEFNALAAHESVESTTVHKVKLVRSQTLRASSACPPADPGDEEPVVLSCSLPNDSHLEVAIPSGNRPDLPCSPHPNHPISPVPRVPFVPAVIFAKPPPSGTWEAREKLLESLKQKVQRLEPDS